jgi:aspartyl-tRNA(Asn)/glutamyl-tRNA(Gln) amidotransferase subunit C
MSLTLADVKRVAHLARIEVNEAEAEGYLKQLSNIFALVEQMQAVDTTGIEPMAHAQDVVLRLREDAVTETDQHQAFQAIAPQVEAGLYLVPKVIE